MSVTREYKERDANRTVDPSLREREWLEREVTCAASLTDEDRIRILRDLLRTADAIRRTKSAEQLRRDDEVRRALDEPGRVHYRDLVNRLAPAK